MGEAADRVHVVEPVAGEQDPLAAASGDVPTPAEVAGTLDAAALADGGARVRRRRRQVVARPRTVLCKLSEAEFEVLRAAAAQAGVTVTGYVSSRAVAVARGEVAPLPSSTGDAVRELVAARTMLRRYASLLNQAVAKLNATGVADQALAVAVARCEEATAGMSEAAMRLGQQR